MADTRVEGRAGEELPARGAARHAGHPSAKEYVRIGVILGVLTAGEVATYYLDVGGALIPILFVLALIKFSLVVLFFMHLKFDSRTYSRFFVMGIAGAVTLYLVVLISFRTFLR